MPVASNDQASDDPIYVAGTVSLDAAALAALTTGAPVNRSGTITTGGTAQNVFAAAARRSYFFQNISAGDLWASWVGTAVADAAGSFKIVAGAAIQSESIAENTALSVVGATTGQKFTAWEVA
jgi:hypothetical protein